MSNGLGGRVQPNFSEHFLTTKLFSKECRAPQEVKKKSLNVYILYKTLYLYQWYCL